MRIKTVWVAGLVLVLGLSVRAQPTPLIPPEAGAYPCSISNLEFGSAFTYTPTGFALVPTAVTNSNPSPLGTLKLDGKGKYTLSGFKAGENAGTYTFANNTLSFKTGGLSKLKLSYHVAHTNGKVIAYHVEVAFGRQAHVCSKSAVSAATLPALKNINAGLKGVLTFEGEFNTVVDFDLQTGKALERYPNRRHPHRIPGGVWAYSQYDQNDVLNPTLVIASGRQTLARFQKGFMGANIVTSSGSPGELPRFLAGSEPVISPDGSRIAFVGMYSLRTGQDFATSFEDKYGLMVIDRNGTLLACLDDAAYGDLPSWTPDNRLVYTNSNAELVLRDKDLQNPKRLGQPKSSHPVVSPDGQRLVYTRNKQEVWLIRTDGSGAQKLLSVGQEVAHFAWAPDGRALALLTKNGVNSGKVQMVIFNGQGVGKVFAVTNPYNEPIFTVAFHLTWWQPGAKAVQAQAGTGSTTPDSSASSPNASGPSTSSPSDAGSGSSSGKTGTTTTANPWPPGLLLNRAYTLTIAGERPWPLVFERSTSTGLQGTVKATIDDETQVLPSQWNASTATLELIDDDERIRCVFERLQNSVLLGTASYVDATGSSEPLGSCELRLSP